MTAKEYLVNKKQDATWMPFEKVVSLMESYHQAKLSEITEEEIAELVVYVEQNPTATAHLTAQRLLSKLKGDD